MRARLHSLLLLGSLMIHSVFAQEGTAVQSKPGPRKSSAKSDLKAFLVQREKGVWEAIKRKDKYADAALLAEDFVGLYDTGFAGKAGHVNQMDEQYTLTDYKLEDVKLIQLNAETALLLYKATCVGSGSWSQYCSTPSYVSSLWVRRKGKWVNLFSQDTAAKVDR